ncbi:MAG: hypothetical protein OTI36_09485 [Beijerinckiaceae bacterium]|nr:hypothetical protein [Beijerinckiaceae bacterium]
MINRPYLPMKAPEDVIPHLGSPHRYRDRFSAKAIAEAWFRGFPTMIEHTLRERCDHDAFEGVELVDAFLERRIGLEDGARPSQADVLAVLGLASGIAIMAVEGKVRESFGETVASWLAGASKNSRKPKRLQSLAQTLGMEVPHDSTLRYQLIHRTASAIYEARRYRAKVAVMMVHSFDYGDTGIADFKAFASAMGFSGAQATRVVGPKRCGDIDLYLGWTADR